MLVEDHIAFREAIAWMLGSDSEFEVVGQASTVEGARAYLPEADIAVIDFYLPDGEGTTVMKELRQENCKDSAKLNLTYSRFRLIAIIKPIHNFFLTFNNTRTLW